MRFPTMWYVWPAKEAAHARLSLHLSNATLLEITCRGSFCHILPHYFYFSRKMGNSQSRTQLEEKDWFLFSASVYTKYISGCVILAVLLGGR